MSPMFQSTAALTGYPVETILLNLVYSIALGVFIAMVYVKTHKGVSYSQAFVHTLVLVNLITTIVMMVIGNNLARAFGLVGALSIIRFRTVVKDTKDIAFIFLSLVIGMAVGTNAYLVALLGTAAGAGVAAALGISNFGSRVRTNFLLKFRYHPEKFDEASFQSLVRRYFLTSVLMNVSTLRIHELMESIYDVEFKNPKENKKFLSEMGAVSGVEKVQLVSALGHQEF